MLRAVTGLFHSPTPLSGEPGLQIEVLHLLSPHIFSLASPKVNTSGVRMYVPRRVSPPVLVCWREDRQAQGSERGGAGGAGVGT